MGLVMRKIVKLAGAVVLVSLALSACDSSAPKLAAPGDIPDAAHAKLIASDGLPLGDNNAPVRYENDTVALSERMQEFEDYISLENYNSSKAMSYLSPDCSAVGRAMMQHTVGDYRPMGQFVVEGVIIEHGEGRDTGMHFAGESISDGPTDRSGYSDQTTGKPFPAHDIWVKRNGNWYIKVMLLRGNVIDCS